MQTDEVHEHVDIKEDDIKEDEDKGDDIEDGDRIPFDPKDLRIRTIQPTISNIVDRIANNEIDLSPDFQRRSGLWKPPAKSRLIESLLVRIPLPTFYVEEMDDGRWIIIDGLQRLTILQDYILEKKFALCDLQFYPEFVGKIFSELDRAYQRRINETQVTVSLIEKDSSDKIKYAIFERINTGGLVLSPQEIRHAMNQGPVAKLLQKIAEDPRFAKATWNPQWKRMEERECILRFLAFYHYGVDSYPEKHPSLDSFLNHRMKQLNKETSEVLDKLENNFFVAIDIAGKLFGERAFQKPSISLSKTPFNKAIFEAWAVAIAHLSDDEREQLIQKKDFLVKKFRDLIENDNSVSASFTSSTGQKGRVKTRFQAIKKIISDTLK